MIFSFRGKIITFNIPNPFRPAQHAGRTANIQTDMLLRSGRSWFRFRFRFLLPVTCLLTSALVPLHAQVRNANWVFAPGVWLHFTPDTIVSVAMSDTVSLRNASMSDTSGQFVLLADDMGIRNALFATLQGGSSSELGWHVPAANYLILPSPGIVNHYGVFINEQPPSSRAGFVQVDLEANNGAGAVVGGTTWYMENVTAKITATPDSTSTGYWILQHDDVGDAFRAFHFTSGGLDTAPVISHVGTNYHPDVSPKENIDRYGQMNFNFQGDLLAAIKNGPSIDTSMVEIFRFNRQTGALQLAAEIGAHYYYGASVPTGSLQALLQGVDFDLSGNYMYVNHVDTSSTTNNSWFVQYDLGVPWDSLITSSSVLTNGVSGDTLRYDNRFGNQFAATPYGKFLIRRPINPLLGSPTFQPMIEVTIPDPDPTSGWVHYSFANLPIPGGFPAPCKRYIDSPPISTGIGQRATSLEIVGIRPNPMIDRAALVSNGPARPESVIWRDALGRVVRRAAVGRIGPTYTLERDGLPAGTYMVEVLGKQGTLGVVKVLCE